MAGWTSRLSSHPILAPLRRRLTRSQLTKRFARGVGWTLAGNVAWRFLSAVSAILIARILGPQAFGELGIIRSTVGIFAVYGGARLGTTATKHVAEYREKDPEKAARILKLALTVSGILCAFMAVALLAASPFLADWALKRPELATTLALGSVLLFFLTYGNFKSFALAGFESFRAIAKVNMWRGVATILLVVPLAYVWRVEGAIGGLAVVATLMFFSFSTVLGREKIKARFPKHIPFRQLREELPVLWQFALPGFLMGILGSMMLWVGRVILVRQEAGYTELGLFEAADQWRTMILFLPIALARVILPILSETYGHQSDSEFKKAISLHFQSILLITLPLTALVIGLADPLSQIYGSKFKGTEAVIPTLMLSVFFSSMSGSFSIVFTSSGRRWKDLQMHVCWAFVFFLGCLVFIPRMGAAGFALTQLVAYALLFLIQSLYVDFVVAPGTLRKLFPLFAYSLFVLVLSYIVKSHFSTSSVWPILFFLFIMALVPALLKFRKR